MARVKGFPVQVQIDSSFTSDQQQLIRQAADDWNRLAQTAIGHPVFTVSDPITIDPSVRSINPSDCSQDYGSTGTLVILRETDEGHWESLGFNQQIPGATIRCSENGVVKEQITIVNTELPSVNVQGSGGSDILAKVFTHELGHSLGLDHSCNGNSTVSSPDYASCAGLDSSSSYHQAIMYPWIQPDSSADSTDGGQSPTPSVPASYLQDNDHLRGSCIMRSTGT